LPFDKGSLWPRGYPLEDVEESDAHSPTHQLCRARPLIHQVRKNFLSILRLHFFGISHHPFLSFSFAASAIALFV
jgi:hypothetical protein